MSIAATKARRPSPGFTLLEVVIAAGLLLMTVAAVTTCVAAASRGAARLQASMDADRAAHAVAERLRVLPYCADAYPDPGAPGGVAAASLVAAVFPHARAAENTEAACYVAAGGEADAAPGSFVTLMEEGSVHVRCVALFLAHEGGPELGAADVEGWSFEEGTAPPGAVLVVRLTAESRGATRSLDLTRPALATPVARQSWSAVAGRPS